MWRAREEQRDRFLLAMCVGRVPPLARPWATFVHVAQSPARHWQARKAHLQWMQRQERVMHPARSQKDTADLLNGGRRAAYASRNHSHCSALVWERTRHQEDNTAAASAGPERQRPDLPETPTGEHHAE